MLSAAALTAPTWANMVYFSDQIDASSSDQIDTI